MKETSYSIGQVSRLLGLSVEGIRNYEKAGIIASRRKEESGYRMYRYLDITSLLRARMYRSLGFSLPETQALTNEYETGEVITALQARRETLSQEQILLDARLSYLCELIEETKGLDGRLGQVEIREAEPCFRMEFSKDGVIDFSPKIVEGVHRWMEMAPFVHVSTRYQEDHVYGGLAILEKYATLFGLQESEGLIHYLPRTLCLRTTVQEDDNGHSSLSCLQALKAFAEYHRFTLSEDIIGHTVMGIQKKTAYKRYRQIDARILMGAEETRFFSA